MDAKTNPEFHFQFKEIKRRQNKIGFLRGAITELYNKDPKDKEIENLEQQIRKHEEMIGLIYDEIKTKQHLIAHSNFEIFNKFH